MPENRIQPVAAQAVTQYVQNQAANQAKGLFPSVLEAAVSGSAQSTLNTGASTPTRSGAEWTQSLVPLILSSLSQDGGSGTGLLPLLILALASGGSGTENQGSAGLSGLLGGSGALGSLLGGSAGLSGLGGLLSGSDGLGGVSGLLDTGSLLMGGGMNGGFTQGAASGAAMQATTIAAQALLKAYQKPAQGASIQPSTSSAQSFTEKASSVGRAAASILSSAANRSASLYRSVIDQFNVERNPRYAVNQKGTGDTYCNVFMLDVTEAMGAPIPRRIIADTGEPTQERSGNVLSMNANRISNWLNTHGERYGWYEVTAEQAQALANRGCPAVTVWKNTQGGHGHVQVVSPSQNSAYDPERGVAIAQAGRILSNYTHIRNIYSSRLKDVQYFAHR